MKFSTVLATLFAALVLAGPVKRALVTEWEYVVVTVTVTSTHHPTSAAQVFDRPKHHSGRRSTLSTVTTASSAIAADPTSSTTSAAVVKTTPSATSTVAATPAASKPANSAGSGTDFSNLSDYAKPILLQHNLHRDNHTAPPLVWNDTLADVARQIAETCVYAHSRAFGDGQYGQNIGAGAPPEDSPKLITDSMYNGEINFYPGYGAEPDMSNFHVWGHFSQIVWKDTVSVGCYTNKCGVLQNVGSNVAPYFTVCNYMPAGNYGGQYSANVLRPLGQASVVV